MKHLILALALAYALCSISCSSTEDQLIVKCVLSSQTLTLTPGDVSLLSCTFYPSSVEDQHVEWTSADTAVAVVSDGEVRAIGVGATVITATPLANEALRQQCYLTVATDYIGLSGEVSGTWAAHSRINVEGQINVPQGQRLVIEEGVEVIFNSADELGTAIELLVEGDIVARGTQDHPIRFSIPANLRSWQNVTLCDNLWGGIVLCNTDEGAVALFEHCIIEYTGAMTTETSPSVMAGINTAGDDYGIALTTSSSFKGSLVVVSSAVQYTYADGIYMQGGKAIIANNVFRLNGATGGEGVNVKAGTSTLIVRNTFFGPNTNALKLSSAGQDDDAGRYQARCLAHSNTIVNAGWRRDGNKGGSVYAEKNVRATVVGNLMINCKYRAQTPSWGTPGIKKGADLSTIIDYNVYLSGSALSPLRKDQEEGAVKAPWQGYTAEHENYYTPPVDEHSAWDTEPMSIAAELANYPYATAELTATEADEEWDFTLTSQWPAPAVPDSLLELEGVPTAIVIEGKTYTAD